ENGPETHLVRHHLSVGLFGLVEAELLDARLHAVKLAERDGLLRVERRAARPARDALAAQEVEARKRELAEGRRDEQELSARFDAVERALDRIDDRRGREDDIG